MDIHSLSALYSQLFCVESLGVSTSLTAIWTLSVWWWIEHREIVCSAPQGRFNDFSFFFSPFDSPLRNGGCVSVLRWSTDKIRPLTMARQNCSNDSSTGNVWAAVTLPKIMKLSRSRLDRFCHFTLWSRENVNKVDCIRNVITLIQHLAGWLLPASLSLSNRFKVQETRSSTKNMMLDYRATSANICGIFNGFSSLGFAINSMARR